MLAEGISAQLSERQATKQSSCGYDEVARCLHSPARFSSLIELPEQGISMQSDLPGFARCNHVGISVASVARRRNRDGSGIPAPRHALG